MAEKILTDPTCCISFVTFSSCGFNGAMKLCLTNWLQILNIIQFLLKTHSDVDVISRRDAFRYATLTNVTYHKLTCMNQFIIKRHINANTVHVHDSVYRVRRRTFVVRKYRSLIFWGKNANTTSRTTCYPSTSIATAILHCLLPSNALYSILYGIYFYYNQRNVSGTIQIKFLLIFSPTLRFKRPCQLFRSAIISLPWSEFIRWIIDLVRRYSSDLHSSSSPWHHGKGAFLMDNRFSSQCACDVTLRRHHASTELKLKLVWCNLQRILGSLMPFLNKLYIL